MDDKSDKLRGILEKLKRLILQLSVFEHVTIVISCLYGLGVILRMQYESLWLLPGFTWNNPLLPFAVAIQYIIYLTVPVVTIVLPIICASYLRNWIKRVLCFVGGIILLHCVFASLFHYFIPFTYMFVPINGSSISINFWIIVNFWRLYYVNDVLCLGFALVIVGFLGLYFRRGAKSTIGIGLPILLFLFGIVCNMYGFNKFFYRNISQAAYGGNGVIGILTLEDAPDIIRTVYIDMPNITNGEISIPCVILDNSGDWLIILELKRSHESFGEIPLLEREISGYTILSNNCA